MTNESPHERKLPREQHLQQPQTSIHKPSKKTKNYGRTQKERNPQNCTTVHRQRSHRTPRHSRRTELQVEECGMWNGECGMVALCAMWNGRQSR